MKKLAALWSRIDKAIRAKLCTRHGHKFYVGGSGYYPGLPQAHCWRCGKTQPNNDLPDAPPLGGWFN